MNIIFLLSTASYDAQHIAGTRIMTDQSSIEKSPQLISLNEVVNITSLSSTSIWREERADRFPKRKQISPNRVAWLRSDVEDWITSKLEAAK